MEIEEDHAHHHLEVVEVMIVEGITTSSELEDLEVLKEEEPMADQEAVIDVHKMMIVEDTSKIFASLSGRIMFSN